MGLASAASQYSSSGLGHHAVEWHEIAYWQISRAIECYMRQNLGDYVCATTLAGAADEILGTLCKEEGYRHALDNLLDFYKTQFPEFREKDLRQYVFNVARDSYKHANPDLCDIKFDPQLQAWMMISRAIYNFCKLRGKTMEEFIKFLDTKPAALQ